MRQVFRRPTLPILALAALALVLASCGGDGPAGETAASETTLEAAPATTSSPAEPVESTQPAAKTGGSCAEELQPESVEGIACAWIADADPAVCESMSDRLLLELFGRQGAAGIEGCRETIGGVLAVDDKTLVSFEQPALVEEERAKLELTDASRSPKLRYTFTFVRRDGRWALDATEHVGSAPAERPTVSPEDAAAAGEIRELVEFWYAEANPAVCEFMTAEMLDFGWGKTGAAGRDLCRTNVAQAEPLENVKVRRPRVSGDTARVEVVYTLDGERQFDRISLIRRDDEWLIDSVVLAGFVSD